MNRLPFRTALVAVLVPFALAVAGGAVQLAWLGRLPAEVAVHWGFDGPDAWAPTWTVPLLLMMVGVVVPALFGVLLARTARPEGPTAMQKVLAVASLFVGTLMSVLTTGSLAIQLDASASGDPDILLPLVAGFGAGALLALGGWFVLPRAAAVRAGRGVVVEPVPVSPGERVVWVGHAHFSTVVLTSLAAVVAVVAALMAFVIASTGFWLLAIVPLIVGVAVLGGSRFTVRVDRAGLSVRATLGWPLFRVPLADLESATVSQVEPLAEFGGYGVRFGLGRRLGIITRSGEALEARRRDGRALVVTVDDAGTAAGLLTALSG